MAELRAARRDTLVFAVLTILLTPVFVGLALLPLACRDADRARRVLERVAPLSRRRVGRSLGRLEFVGGTKEAPVLTGKGRKFVGLEEAF